MQSVRKYLVYDYVPIMDKTFRSGTGQSCVAQRSIYVILGGNEETRRHINQVRIYKFVVKQTTNFETHLPYSIFFETLSKNRFVRRSKRNETKMFKYFRIE